MRRYRHRPLATYPARMRPFVVVLFALAVLAGACGAPSYGAPPAQAPAAPATAPAATPALLPSTGAQPTSAAAGGQSAGQTVNIGLVNFAFAPKVLSVAPGTTVVWQNNDSAAHTVTADNGSFDSGNMDQGATFKFTFAKTGTYAYYCRYHGGPGGQGMSGQIVVK